MIEAQSPGLAQLTRSLGQLGQDLAALDDEQAEAAELVARQVRVIAPARRGVLRAGIRATPAGEVVATARHSGPIEYGVGPRPGLPGPHNIAPAGFMRQARRSTEPAVKRLFTVSLTKSLQKVKAS